MVRGRSIHPGVSKLKLYQMFEKWETGNYNAATYRKAITAGFKTILRDVFESKILRSKSVYGLPTTAEERRQYEFEQDIQILDPSDPLLQEHRDQTFWKEVENKRLRDYLDAALSKIPEKKRFVLEEHFYHGRTPEEIGEDLPKIGYPPIGYDGVSYLIKRGLESLREVFYEGRTPEEIGRDLPKIKYPSISCDGVSYLIKRGLESLRKVFKVRAKSNEIRRIA